MVVEPVTDRPDLRFQPGSIVHTDEGLALTVVRYRPTDRAPLVSFAEVGGRTDADALRGTPLFIHPDQRRPLEPDEFWPEDLIGAAVVDPEGAEIGVVADVELGWAQDRLYVEPSGPGEAFIVPLVAALVVDVDLGAGVVTAALPPGLAP